jgi:tetratricopeptide (TPR) repeat protein
MKRTLRLTQVFAGFLVMVAAGLSSADDIEYRKGEKTEKASGDSVKESINGIDFKTSIGKGKDINVPLQDLVDISYEAPGTMRIPYANIISLEKKKDFVKALEEYKKNADAFSKSAAPDKLKRQIDYRIAMLKAQLAEADAIEKLEEFLKKYPNSWQTISVSKQLALLALDKLDADKAITTLDTVSKTAGLNKDLKLELDLALLGVRFQSGKYPDVAAALPALISGNAPGTVARGKLDAYQHGVNIATAKVKFEDGQKSLEALIEKSNDPSVKAVAYHILGDCFILGKQPREAMWNYLYIDVVYFQDKQEHQRVLSKLARLFENDFKDADRAKAFRDKATKIR